MTEKLHIVIVARGGSSWLGGRQYSINLLRALDAERGDSGAYDISVLVRGRDEIAAYEPMRSRLRELANFDELLPDWTVPNRARWKLKRTLRGWTNPRIEEQLLRIGATFAYPVTSRIVPSADWISDFQYDHFPDLMSQEEIAARKAEFSAIMRGAQRIVLSSAYAERDCHRVFPQTVGRTCVVRFRAFTEETWTRVDPQATVHKYNLPQAYFLISNWLLPTKNHLFVLDALAEIPAEMRKHIHIACTGDLYDYRNPGFYNAFLSKIHMLGLRDNVSVLGVISKQDQIQLLRACRAYLTPSLSEGWNTGVEEAHLFGKAILLSDIDVHREQNPARSVFFDPRKAGDLASKLTSLADATAQADSIARRVAEEKAFSAYAQHQRQFARCFLDLCTSAGARKLAGVLSS
jgi:glycosyltransferase involved in cell wall biosynthesis